MSLHLLTAIATLYSTTVNQELIRMQRVGYIQGYYTLSDLVVQDTWHTDYPLTGYDRLYTKYVQWSSVYIPSEAEHLSVYSICYPWFCKGPVPPLSSIHSVSQLVDIEATTMTDYTKACVGACGALRSLLSISAVEVEQLCEDILLYIGGILKYEIQDLPIDVIERRMVARRITAQRKLNKIN